MRESHGLSVFSPASSPGSDPNTFNIAVLVAGVVAIAAVDPVHADVQLGMSLVNKLGTEAALALSILNQLMYMEEGTTRIYSHSTSDTRSERRFRA